MLSIFSDFASWLIYSIAGLDSKTKIGQSVHFFVEDTTKIFFLLVVMIYFIALIRASLNVEKVRDFLANKHRGIGYIFGSVFGAITPFCSCSSIPVFLGFTSAGIPIGITMAFLITSPIINEVAILLLLSLVGWQITVIYAVVGMAVGIICGMFLDMIKGEKMLQSFAYKAYLQAETKQKSSTSNQSKMSWQQRHRFAKHELIDILSRVWKWVFIGVGIGSILHGFIPEGWFESNFGSNQLWSVPIAVFAGIPLYSNATGVIPIMESLITKGLPLGTTMAFCMSTVAVSFPELVLLKQVMQWKLLAILLIMLLIAFTIVGWVLNLIP